jgi:hypothetical protein
MRLYPISLAAGLLPLTTIHICYIVAASNGHVDWCIPYIDSCTSISATGREQPEYYLFKALMIPSALILVAFWWLSCQWLVTLGCKARKRRSALLCIGFIASIGLILYSVMLGSIDDAHRLSRRIGVTTFFGMTYLAQLLLIYLLANTRNLKIRYLPWLRVLESLAMTVLIVGIASVVLSIYDYELYKRTDNAFEWTFTLLLCLFAVVNAVLWKKTNFLLLETQDRSNRSFHSHLY